MAVETDDTIRSSIEAEYATDAPEPAPVYVLPDTGSGSSCNSSCTGPTPE